MCHLQGMPFTSRRLHLQSILTNSSMTGFYVPGFKLQKLGEKVPGNWPPMTGTQEEFLVFLAFTRFSDSEVLKEESGVKDRSGRGSAAWGTEGPQN